VRSTSARAFLRDAVRVCPRIGIASTLGIITQLGDHVVGSRADLVDNEVGVITHWPERSRP
jgi:hypothetical protein